MRSSTLSTEDRCESLCFFPLAATQLSARADFPLLYLQHARELSEGLPLESRLAMVQWLTHLIDLPSGGFQHRSYIISTLWVQTLICIYIHTFDPRTGMMILTDSYLSETINQSRSIYGFFYDDFPHIMVEFHRFSICQFTVVYTSLGKTMAQPPPPKNK